MEVVLNCGAAKVLFFVQLSLMQLLPLCVKEIEGLVGNYAINYFYFGAYCQLCPSAICRYRVVIERLVNSGQENWLVGKSWIK
jgi:hypothetical protein